MNFGHLFTQMHIKFWNGDPTLSDVISPNINMYKFINEFWNLKYTTYVINLVPPYRLKILF